MSVSGVIAWSCSGEVEVACSCSCSASCSCSCPCSCEVSGLEVIREVSGLALVVEAEVGRTCVELGLV